MEKLKILSLNVNNFGGKYVKLENIDMWNSDAMVKDRLERAGNIADWVLMQDARIVVLQEFEIGKIGATLIDRLVQAKYEIHYEKIRTGSVVLIAVKDDFYVERTFISKEGHLDATARWIELIFTLKCGKKFKVIGVHMPLNEKKREQFRRELANISNSIPTVIIGDFNAAGWKDRALNDRSSMDKSKVNAVNENESLVQDILSKGYIDAWRVKNVLSIQEYTWFYEQNKLDGRRLDYAFLSNDLELQLAEHFHDVNITFNRDGLTDHSALVVELKVT